MHQNNVYYHLAPQKKRYGFLNFIFDFIMVCVTGGFWLIWIFVREMRNAR